MIALPPAPPFDPVEAALAADPADRSAAYLADFPLRLVPASDGMPLTRVPRPGPGEDWTLAQTLQEVRLRRVALVETSRGVRPRHPARLDVDLLRALNLHARPLRVWLRLRVGAGRVPAPWAARGWDDATRLHAAWFGLAFDPPALPIALRPGVRVADWPRFRAAVADALALGPDAPGAARVAEDLAALYARFGTASERIAAGAVRAPLAA